MRIAWREQQTHFWEWCAEVYRAPGHSCVTRRGSRHSGEQKNGRADRPGARRTSNRAGDRLALAPPGLLAARAPDAALARYRQVHRELCESRELGARLSGTTATVVVHDVARQRLVVSHVGDSGVVLLRRSGAGGLVARRLTRDHKPELEEERARIEALRARRGVPRSPCALSCRSGVTATAFQHAHGGLSFHPETQDTELHQHKECLFRRRYVH